MPHDDESRPPADHMLDKILQAVLGLSGTDGSLPASPLGPWHDHPEVPVEQWQTAACWRTLTPMEQAAREAYFDRRVSEALARVGLGD